MQDLRYSLKITPRYTHDLYTYGCPRCTHIVFNTTQACSTCVLLPCVHIEWRANEILSGAYTLCSLYVTTVTFWLHLESLLNWQLKYWQLDTIISVKFRFNGNFFFSTENYAEKQLNCHLFHRTTNFIYHKSRET